MHPSIETPLSSKSATKSQYPEISHLRQHWKQAPWDITKSVHQPALITPLHGLCHCCSIYLSSHTELQLGDITTPKSHFPTGRQQDEAVKDHTPVTHQGKQLTSCHRLRQCSQGQCYAPALLSAANIKPHWLLSNEFLISLKRIGLFFFVAKMT